jgi:two-component system CheB/CheR fusion protein
MELSGPSAAPSSADGVRVVGIASSAGGLEALRELFEGLPESGRLSYVVAQHLSPTHVSTLVDLLAPHTRLRVVNLAQGDRPQAGTVAVIPPNQDAVYARGRFRLLPPQNTTGPKPSADALFQSLAQELGEAAVGIVLSGTGSDGAAGLREIKAAGGLTIAQEPASAKYDGMPLAAIRTGGVDLVLRPADIGPTLRRLAEEAADVGALTASQGDEEIYTQITQLVRVRTAFKLDEYKSGTVRRRIARRLGLLNLATLAAYLEHLRSAPEEAHQLVRDTFISVTSFFRDADAWRVLERTVGTLVRGSGGGVLRCWVPGCATGEEAYSLAMLLEEALRDQRRADLQYMVFASDLDEAALDQARQAVYSPRALAELPDLLRERYVEMDGEGGRVRKDLRARVVFARQNVIDDPPFSRMDLISCRNLLIYLNPPVQRRVLELFHYALQPGGQLFLGRSEALDGHADLFAPVDPAARLYQRLEGFKRGSPSWRQPEGLGSAEVSSCAERRAEPPAEAAGRLMLAQLVRRFAPPSLLLDQTNAVKRFEGALKPFLDFPHGDSGMQLFDMVDESIRAELRALVYRCRRDQSAVVGAAHRRDLDGVPHAVRVHIEPLAQDASGLLLLSFIASPQGPEAPAECQPDARDTTIVAELARELADTREHLVIVVDELQSTNERLQSANEESQSTNEELQSTNEELRTVNEELQSANEELLTVNEELQAKSGELETSASMLINVKQSLDFPLLVVDLQRRVLDANRACRQLVHNDTPLQGQSIHGLAWRFPIGSLDEDLQRLFDGGARSVHELPGEGGQLFRLHVMPYRTGRQELAGAVLLFEDVTALRGAEAERLESESRYRQVTESLPQLVWTCTADGPCDYLSPQWVRYTGVPEAEQLGFGWLEQLHPDDRQRTVDHWMSTAGQGLDFEVEFRIRRYDGAYRWFHTQARPLRDAQGRVVKWYGSNTDIDDRKSAEAALQLAAATLEQRVAVRTAELERASAELAQAVRELEDLFHNAPCGYHSIDPQGRILRINDTELRWLGYGREEVVGRPVGELMTPAGRATLAANYPRILGGETLTDLEVEFLRKDGRILPMLVSATPVFDAEGRYLHSRSVLLDHTKMRAQQQTLRRILTAAPMAVRVARLSDNRTVFVNEAFTKLVQRSTEEAIELDVRQFYVDKAAFDGIVQRLAAGESVRNQLVELHRPEDPANRVWALASFMVVDYEGQRAALAWLFDVTELEQAKRLAEGASLAKSRFLANMSHEIRTPMNGVIGMIEHARRDLKDPLQVERLDKALGSARRLLAILNDILDLSKIEAGHAKLNPAPTDLADCAEGLRALYDQVAQQKGLVLVIELDPVLTQRSVMTDALRLRQVLDNLVANAIKFSSQGEVRLRIAPEHEDAAGVTVCFEVIDQGVGIAPRDQARVFEMFEQANVGSGARPVGTGLGLAISRDLVDMMGGTIGLHSQPGQGSTFWFKLPMTWAAQLPTAAPGPLPTPSTDQWLRHAGARALVAEDNELNQEVLRLFLEDLGLQVEIAADGRQAFDVAARSRYDLIFIDMQMPVMDGLEATRALRREGLNLHTPVIAMTANAFEEDRQACLDAGMNDFLAKPLLPEELERKAFEWLERRTA